MTITRRHDIPQTRWIIAPALAATMLIGLLASSRLTAADPPRPHQLTFANDAGVMQTLSTSGPIDIGNPFFQDLGSNGRSCVTCHRPAQAWTITPEEIRDRFEDTRGLDPLFRTNDGSNCEGADVSTIGKRRRAFSLLLSKGLIRVGMNTPADAEFEIVAVDDPYGCGAPLTGASMYRRPLPTANLGFLSTVMWDGRETVKGQAIAVDLLTQASDATTGHAQGVPPSASELRKIVEFEIGLFTAQTRDRGAGSLTAQDAKGGPRALSTEPFCIGINDPLNLLPSVPGACELSSGGLNPVVFTLFDSWRNAASPHRQAIARGEQIFNTREFVINGVRGLNGDAQDPLGVPLQHGTCTVCHDTPNAGNHSISMPLDLGLTSAANRTPDLPLYTLRNKATFETTTTTDPGRAMVTGKWADVGKFKGPVLRALAARAPYFHNGAAATLEEAIEFYNTRFAIGLTPREKADLAAFLRAL